MKKFFGVAIDWKLTWKGHIALVTGKLSQSIGMISKARRCLNWKSFLISYYSFIYPYLKYCTHVWGSTYTTNLEKIFVLQKKVLRIMCSIPKRSSTDPLFYELGILKFHDINLYWMGKFMFRFYKSEVPELFVNFFNSNAETYDYFTWHHSHLHPTGTYTTAWRKSSVAHAVRGPGTRKFTDST